MSLSGAISQWDFTKVDRKACASPCNMAGSGCGCVHRQKREVILSSDRGTCDFEHLSVSHLNDNWCANSAIRTCTVPVSEWKSTSRTDQRQQQHACGTHGLLPTLSLAKWQRFGHGPFDSSLHNSLWYFFIFTVLLFSQSLQVSAQSFTRRPSNQRPVLGEDVTLQCAYSEDIDIIWQHSGNLLFVGPNRQISATDRHSLVNDSDLKITGVILADSGNYTCTPSGKAVAEATITVLVAPGQPVITPDVSTSNLREGDSLTLTCTSSGGNPSPTLVWKRNGQVVSAGRTSTGPKAGDTASNQLTRDLDWTDHQATYTCEATNEVNQGRPATRNTTLNVRYSPRITFGPYNPYRTEEGERVTLTCEVNANPTSGMTYKWEKDGVVRPQRSNSLLFDRIEKTDNGIYSCFVYNSVGPEKNSSVLLDVQYAPEIVEWQNQVIVNESDSVTLTCKSLANPDPESVRWTSSSGNSQYNPSFIFDRVLRRDADNYTCVVTNRLQLSGRSPESRSTERTLELLVQYPPGVPTFNPIDAPSVGDRVEIKCLLSDPGYPVGTIEWQKDGSSEIVARDVYTIETAALTDSGVYKCRGKNIMGTGEWSRIQLDVNEPPRFVTTLPPSQNVNITETGFQLQCRVRGRPQPEVQWKKNGNPFDVRGDGDFYEIRQSAMGTDDSQSFIVTSTLAFRGFKRLHRENGRADQLVMEDTANYTCASGTISQTIQIFVQYAPDVIVTPRKVAPDVNSTVTFTCLAKANPEPYFEWHFNEQVLNSVGKYRIQSGGRGKQEYEYTSILTVSETSPADHGEYKCTATNTQGTSTQTAAIVDKSVPDASTELKVLGKTWNSVYLDWTPGFNGGEHQTFLVYYTSDVDADSVEAPRNGFNITELHPSTTYMLRVVGMNGHGPGPKSAAVNTTTMSYNFTVPTGVKFDHGSNTLFFEPPGPGYFAKVEVWINDAQGWEMYEEKANTEGGSIKLEKKNIQKCRVSFCLESPPHVCSSSVEAQSVGDRATTASGDLPTGGVVAIACVCALIIIALCIVLVCVIRKKKQDKAAKDYELETQPNRRSQPINNPKDIRAKSGYDNPDFASHQIQRNGHVPTAPIPNGKLNHYKSPMNTDNSFESGDMNKYDDFDPNNHHSYGDEPLAFIPYSSMYYSQGDPHYNYDGPRGDYTERPPSHLKDSVSGQESGYSTPEPTKPKKLPKFLQRKRGLVYYADSAAFSHNPPGHTCGLPCCQTGNDLQILLGSSRANCVGMQTSCHNSNFSLGRANRNLLQGRPTFKNGNFSLRPFTQAERLKIPNFGQKKDNMISATNEQVTFSKQASNAYHMSGNVVQDGDDKPLRLADFAVGECADDFEDSDGPLPYYQILPFGQGSDLKWSTSSVPREKSESSERDSGVYDKPEFTDSINHVYAALPIQANKSGNMSKARPEKPRVPPLYAEVMAARLAKKLAVLSMAEDADPEVVSTLPAGCLDGPDDRYSTFPKLTPFMGGMASGLMNSFPDQPKADAQSASQSSSDIEEEMDYFDRAETVFEDDDHALNLSAGNSFSYEEDREHVDDVHGSEEKWPEPPDQVDDLDAIRSNHCYNENYNNESHYTDTAPITLIL